MSKMHEYIRIHEYLNPCWKAGSRHVMDLTIVNTIAPSHLNRDVASVVAVAIQAKEKKLD
jgi:hypothetical protein